MAFASPVHTPLPKQPLAQLTLHRHRKPLTRTPHKISTGALTVGFIGGSITADYGQNQNWPGPVAKWLVETFPHTRFTIENAAIGATGSDSACLRAQRELIAHDCDLTFVEFAVNDFEVPTPRRNRSREGLIRQLLAAGQEVILVYTFRQDFYAEMMAGRVPASIAEFEVIAEHYGLSSVWMGLAALREVCAGGLTWEEWLPDGLHPQYRGSWSYGQAVNDFLRVELSPEKIAQASSLPEIKLPAPLDPGNWEQVELPPLASLRTSGPWVLRRVWSPKHVEQVLETHAPGARLEFDFTGRGLVLITQYGKRSAEFEYRIDGGESISVARPRHDWGGDRDMVCASFLTEDLPSGPHRFELVVTHGNRPDCTGTEFRLAVVGVLA
jgi:lysophospholipase L1-like esterase